jgi:hypothetical protein
LRKKKLFRNKFGTKNTQKIHFFPKILRSKSPKNLNYTKGTIGPWYLYAEKRIKEKNYPAAGGDRTNSGFPKKSKKAEKTDFEPLPKA